jgi:hypothetical protein
MDTRWFRFTAKLDWTYTISAFGYTDAGDIAQLSLFEQDGSTLLASDDSTDWAGLPFLDAEIVWLAPAAGSYLVKLFQPLSLAEISTLTAQLGIHGQAPVIQQPTAPPTITPTPVPIVQFPEGDTIFNRRLHLTQAGIPRSSTTWCFCNNWLCVKRLCEMKREPLVGSRSNLKMPHHHGQKVNLFR